jgi:hypothetical protein
VTLRAVRNSFPTKGGPSHSISVFRKHLLLGLSQPRNVLPALAVAGIMGSNRRNSLAAVLQILKSAYQNVYIPAVSHAAQHLEPLVIILDTVEDNDEGKIETY